MAENNTPDPHTGDARAASDASSSLSSSPLFMHSSPPEGEDVGDALLRAADTTMASSPAPTGVTIEPTRKRKRTSRRSVADDDDEDEEEDEEARPRKKGKGKKVGTGRSKKGVDARMIPRTFEECEDLDKKLISMRDSGKGWQDIRRKWQEETGETVGKSTLPNRYMRLKTNFTVINDDDNALLLKCHREVEEAFEDERWGLVSKAMAKAGTQVYMPDVLSRQFKKLMYMGANLRAGRDINEGLEK